MNDRKNDPIGMFDSGAGGISVLREAMKQLPNERFLFYGDTLNAPYGTKTKEEVLCLAQRAVKILLGENAKAVVIACNTATSAAAAELRAQYPDIPIIGMEPALKPASLLHRDGVVLSLATPGTIAGEKYARLKELYGAGVISVPCPGLMEFVEKGEMSGPALEAYLRRLFSPYLDQPVEALVLGCTHYVFLKKAISAFFPGVPLIDGNGGTVRQLAFRLREKGWLRGDTEQGEATIWSSGGPEAAERMRSLLHTWEV